MGEAHLHRVPDQPRQAERMAGKIAPSLAGERSGRRSGKALGDQVWFDLATRLVLLLLGALHLWRYGAAGDAQAIATVLVVYGGMVAIACLRLVAMVYRPGRRMGILDEGDAGERALLNFLIDATFVAAVAVLAPYSALMLTGLILLVGLRLFSRAAAAGSALISLPFCLVILVLTIRYAGALTTPAGGAWLVSGVMLDTSLLILALRVVQWVNRIDPAGRRGRGGPERATAADAAHPAPPPTDSQTLEEQLLRLTVLQEGISAMNSAMALTDLLQMVVTNAVRVLKAEQSSIGLLDDTTGELVIQAATGVQSGALGNQRFAPGVGVAGWVIQHGQPLKVDDVENDSRYLHAYSADYTGPTTRCILCVPLKVERQVIGALCVTHSQPAVLTADDERLLMTFAEQASLAVHKTRLLEQRTRQGDELRRRGDLIASLMSIREALLSSLELPEVLSTILTQIRELIWSDDAAIYLLNVRTGEPQLAASLRQRGVAEEHILRPGAATWALWERALLSGPIANCSPTGCLLFIPLIRRGVALGCIILMRPVDSPFLESERDAAALLAEAATLAVDNAQLFSSRSLQQQQATALYQLMIEVGQARTRHELGQVVCTQIQKLTRAGAAALLINDLDQGKFSGCAASGAWQNDPQVESVNLSGQGDSFVGGVLLMLQQRNPGQLLILPAAPPQWQTIFGTAPALAIPLTLGRRILGLLILQPEDDPAVPDDLLGTLSLAVSYCVVALEHAELLEQAVRTARQSATLHKSATGVLSALDVETVVETTAASCLGALPIESCAVYLLDAEHEQLVRHGLQVRLGAEHDGWQPETIPLGRSLSILDAMRSPGLVADDGPLGRESIAATGRPVVILARLMGSGEVMGLVRLTTCVPPLEFMRRYTTFCQTLFMHAGGALQRSFLFTTTARQAAKLRERTRYLDDILRLGNVPTARVPAHLLLPPLAAGIAASLGFAYAEIGALSEDATTVQWYAGAGAGERRTSLAFPSPVSQTVVDGLLQRGHAPTSGFKGVYLTDTLIAGCMPGAVPALAAGDGRLILLPLESTAGAILGYLLAAADPVPATQMRDEQELLEVLSIFAQRVALHLENEQIYAQLLASKRKIEAVVLSISEGVIVTDGAGRMVLSNSLADQTLGVPALESQGHPLARFIHNPALLQQVDECLATGKASTADVDFPVGREVRTYQAAVDAITGGVGGALGAVLTLRDVTLARASERAKSDFLSIVSHELRTPLNSVMAFLDIILMGKTGPLTAVQADFLATAKQESLGLQRLIDELLDYTRLQSRMLRLEQVPMDLSAVILRVARKVAPQVSQEDLCLTNDVPADILVIGDEVQLEQVFNNLFDNAMKFSRPNGEITVDACLHGDTIVVRVKDTGAGIPPAQLAQVFERFFQAENRPERRKPGLGLGLAICKGIVEAHGGRIWIESELGVGTCVSVELAIFAPTPDPDAPEGELDAGSGRADLAYAARPQGAGINVREREGILLDHRIGPLGTQ